MLRRRSHDPRTTTPESLYILLTSDGGRRILRTRSAPRDRRRDPRPWRAAGRGSQASALSLERLDRPPRRPGGRPPPSGRSSDASASRRPHRSRSPRPLAHFCRRRRPPPPCSTRATFCKLDLAVGAPHPLSAVCSHEQWDEIYERIATLVREHRTTLSLSSTPARWPSGSPRASARALRRGRQVAATTAASSAPRRFEREQRLKAGALRVLVATASLELGIGDRRRSTFVVQVGAARSIATLLQRVGQAGHGADRVPKGPDLPD